MKFNRYLLPVFFLLLSSALYSQNAKLSGRVIEENKEALISANVVIDASKGWGAVTDFDGNYEIKNLPAGSYEVVVRYVGKEDQKIKITLAAGENKVLNITLRDKQQIMDEVVISGTKYETKLGEQTVSMDVLKGTSLANQNITSLDEGMTKVPGVTIADGQVNIRGGAGWSYGAGSRVQVLVDDLPLLTADASDAKWSIVPMENVEQVEVIKGAASALYGSGALDGVINVRTAYPTEQTYFKVTGYGGVIEGPSYTPDMKWWGKVPPYGQGVNVAYRQKVGQNDIVIGAAYDSNTGYLDSSGGSSIRANIKYRYRFKKIVGLNMGINVSGYYSWGNTFFFWNGLDSNAYKPFPKTITVYKDYRFTVDPFIDYYDKKGNQFKFVGRFFNATNTNSTGQGSVPNRYYGELQYHRRWEFKKFDFNIVSGLVNVYDDVNPPKGASGSLFGKNNSYNFSAYVQTDFKFWKKFTVSFGARWEYFRQVHYVQDSTGPGNYYQRLDTVQNSIKQLPYPLFRLGLNYQAAEATYIRASFGQGFRYPTIAERFVSTNVGPITIASNPLLNPEKGYSAELGLKQGFKLGKGWAGYMDISGFWNQYDNMMEFSFGQYGDRAYWPNFGHDFGLGFSSQNIGKTRILGTELVFAGQGKIGPVDITLLTGYTYIDPRSLNWNDSLPLVNYQGYQLGNGYNPGSNSAIKGAYNNPTGVTYLTYAQTSTSSTNILKYRNRHTLKVDVTLEWKGLEFNTNLQYSSYVENVDYAFVSPLLSSLYPAFAGLRQSREEKQLIPIGKGRGDIVLNMHLAYNFKQGVRVAFIVKNVLNTEYTPRPAYLETPRNYTLQVSYTWHGKAKKPKAEGTIN
ncbi:MAG: putative vitamin receptor precursor [Bacteroidota bacterium]|nr:putative vitamin receptor precursor [Bacteroidota bacterium]